MSVLMAFRTAGEGEERILPSSGELALHESTQIPRLCLIIFLIFVLPLGIMLAFITPLGGVADETAHALRAESLSHGEILGYRAVIRLPDGSLHPAAGVSADLGLADAAMVNAPGEWVTSDTLRHAQMAPWQHKRRFAEMTPLALYLPVFYAPAALTMAALRVAGASPAQSFLAGRLVNLSVYALLGILALMVARRGHAVLLCTLALPMEVSLAASLNQDGLLIATAVLAIACLTRSADAQNAAPRGRWAPSPAWLAAAFLLGLIALAKIPYAGLLVLLICPIEARRGCATRLLIAALCTLPALAWAFYAMTHIATPWPPLPPYHPGPLYRGPHTAIFTNPDAAAQLKLLVAQPSRILTLTLQSIWAKKGLVLEFIGILGFVSLRLPAPLYALWALALLAAAIADRQRSRPSRFNLFDQFSLAGMLGLIVIGIYMSQYLSWTRVGVPIVQGPTGRYFLPLLPATLFLIPRLKRPDRAMPALFLLPVAAAAVASLIVTPLSVLDGFYAP